MLDNIYIEDLKIFARHGYFDFEKENGQFFYVSARLYLDFQKAGRTDNLDLTVDYSKACEYITKFMTDNIYDTIEAVSEKLAEALLNKYPSVMEVEVRISKPEAPVDATFKNISVTSRRKRHTAYIALGSNEGDSLKIIEDALKDIDEDSSCKLIKQSAIMRSTPYGGVEQNIFYNGAIVLETYLEPYNLLEFLQTIEAKYKRKRDIHWGPRTLDLDIIFYDNEIIDDEKLTVPHPDMAKRDFVLEPLRELAGYFRHPILRKTVNELADAVGEKHIIRK
jgi:dihydroneopterin aldolase/2-amino-4-hydroxy-6-hydroxymethyldihydropteridine diphosphokinase